MPSRSTVPPSILLLLPAVLQHPKPARADLDHHRQSCALYNTRRQRAEHVLTIASAIEPKETAAALRLARSTMCKAPLNQIEPQERTFLTHIIKEAVARGLACAAGGAVASYTILKVVLLVIPFVPSPFLTRFAMSAVSFGAAALELAAVPDLATIELLLMNDSLLGSSARSTIEQYNPHLLLLTTLDRHMLQNESCVRTCPSPDFELSPTTSDWL